VALIGTPTITNIRTGVYRVEVSDNNLIDVVFAIVPHVNDQAAVDDIAVMEVKTYHEVAEILTDTGTTLPASLSTIQTDLDNPNQYKADVSALALEATLTAMKGVGWTDETLVALKSVIDAILVDTGTTLDGKITTIDGIVDAILVDTGTTLPAEINAVYSDVMNATVEGTYTVQEVLRIMAGALAGKLSGGGTTTLTFRDLSDTLDRITATVNTTTGDRTAVTIDKS
jgi:hypothetical protein